MNFIVVANIVINIDKIKCFRKVEDHLVIEYCDNSASDIAFNSEPEAMDALRKLIHAVQPIDEIEDGEVVIEED